ncbi:MAG: OmpA family protein [Polyangiaceae bacterium]|nr:OmpA family protein [Polyangiaceae bacterium]
MQRAKVFSLTTAALALSVSGRAAAQTPALALDRLQPAPAGDPMLAVESPATAPSRVTLAALGSYAKAPLALRRTSTDDRSRVVDYQLVAHLGASLSLARRITVDVDAPAVASQGGATRSVGASRVAAPDGATLGDVRAGARFTLLSPEGGAPGVALSQRVFFPTGREGGYASAGHVRYAPAIVVGADAGGWLWSLSLGRTFRGAASTSARVSGSSLDASAGAAVRVGPVQAGAEAYASTVSDASTDALSRSTTNAEVLGVVRWSGRGLFVTGAAGPGVGKGIGTPAFRAVLAVGGSLELGGSSRERHTTGDARGDARAAEPASTRAAVAPEGAPAAAAPVDTDGDGVLDADDACPSVVGEASATPARNGCPRDTDADGVVDARDACPTAPGVPSDDPAKHGCPPDTDGDGVIDPEDACPREKGAKTGDPKTHGCPTSVRVEGQQIVIMQQVQFETGKDVIKEESFGLLSQVAGVLVEHPDIVRLAVDGHTDDVGSEKNNLALSQRRAVSVLRWLVDHKVDARRLEARGFGPRRPLADNKTPEGRAKNRRVEFQIRLRDARGEAAWRDGPVE